MNELPPSVDPEAQPIATSQQATEQSKPAAPRKAPGIVYLLLLALAAGLGAHWWVTQNEIRELRQEVSRRLHDSENIGSETRSIAKSVQESIKELQAKTSVLENKHIEAQSQWLALEQLYQDLSKTRDDWILAEIEQVLSTASQQLQLAGNVRGALIALENADARLSQSENAQFIQIRRAIARDTEKLKSLPNIDLTGLALRLDSAIGRIDSMPLLSAERPPEPAAAPKTQRFSATPQSTGGERTVESWLENVEQKWNSLTHEMWGEIRQLVQVRRVDTPDALLLSPTQAYYARENLKLRLLSARLALLARNEEAFRSDLMAAQDVIARYFDSRGKQTQTVQELLKQIQASNLLIELPTLADSLNAVRTYKAKPQ